jgi:outer membrane immunogenic protein
MKYLRPLLSCTLIAYASTALAADLAPVPGVSPSFVAPAYSWSGFYIGGQVGYARDTTKSQLQTPAGNVLAGWNDSAGGIIGGVYSGYNWQLGGLVLGLESDFEGSNLNKVSGPVIGLYSGSKLDWQASLRTRIGFAADRTLFYLTGGLADASLGHTLFDAGHSAFFSTNRLGYTVGGGVEQAVTYNLVGRIDYRYTNFGAGNNALNYLNWIGVTGNLYTRHVTEQGLRFGLAYKFGVQQHAAPNPN